MSIRDRFVGRDEELRIFRDRLSAEKGGLLYIMGEGGIGKTWLLRRMAEIARETSGVIAPVAEVELIDFNLTANHRVSGVRLAIVACLGKDHFAEFLGESVKFDELREGDYSEAVVNVQRGVTDQAFLKCCEELAKQSKGVLLFDTFEEVQQHDEAVARWVVSELLPRLHNFVVVITSRVALGDVDIPSEEVERVTLGEFDEDEISARLEKESLNVDDDTRADLQRITRGHPLLIDIALYLLQSNRDISQEGFEEALVREFYDYVALEHEGKLGEIVVRMAHLHRRFGRGMLDYLVDAELIGLQKEEIDGIIEVLQNMRFVKYRSAEDFVLHDIMAELINKYIWRDIDIDGEIRREFSDKILNYYVVAMDKTENEREKQGLLSERLYYQLQVDKEAAYQTFVGLFDDAIAGYSFGFCELLYSEIVEYRAQYSADKQYEIDMRWVKWLRATGENAEAKAKLEAMLAQYADDEKREVEMLTELVNARARLGEFAAAIDNLERARDICERNELSKQLPRVYYLLGWRHKNIWQWDEALARYRACMDASAEVGDDYFAAAALNDSASIHAQQGEYDRARIDAQTALRIRRRTAGEQDDGWSLSTLGEIYRLAGDYQQAARYYEQALEIFEKAEDQEWIAKIMQHRGINKYHIGINEETADLPIANKWFREGLADLTRAIELEEALGLTKDLPRAYHRRAHLHEALGESAEAKRYFQRSYELALQIDEKQTALDSLVEWTRLDCMEGTEDIETYFTRAAAFRDMPQYKMFRALMDISWADIKYQQTDYAGALELYKDAYAVLAQYKGIGVYLLPRQLDKLEKKLLALEEAHKINWCKELEQHWLEVGTGGNYPSMLAMVRNIYFDALLAMKGRDNKVA